MISHSSAWTAEPRDFLTMRRRLAATGEASELDVADGAEPDSVLVPEWHGAEAWPTIEKRGEVLRVEPRRTRRLRRAFRNQRQTGRSASDAREGESLTTSHARPGRRAAQSRPSWARAGTARRWSPASTLRARSFVRKLWRRRRRRSYKSSTTHGGAVQGRSCRPTCTRA